MFEECDVVDLGRIEYKTAWDLQLAYAERRARKEVADTLLLCEHEPVYTFGKAFRNQTAPGLPFPTYKIERGGKATYHGPGQLVIYPIVKLPGPIVVRFMRDLESWIISLVASFGLPAQQRSGETGVWIENRKIASMGIAVRHWVTYHGAALNVNPDLSHFQAIEPCGYTPETMTSLSKELKREVTVAEVKKKI